MKRVVTISLEGKKSEFQWVYDVKIFLGFLFVKNFIKPQQGFLLNPCLYKPYIIKIVKTSTSKRRPLDEEIIMLLLGSTKRPKVGPGSGGLIDKFIDKNGRCKDPIITKQGYALFKHTYRKAYIERLVFNIWNLGLGKLVMPNVFVNVEIIKQLAATYNPDTRFLFTLGGQSLLPLNRDQICKVFQLDPNAQLPIDLGVLRREYERNRDSYRVRWLPCFRPRGSRRELQRFGKGDLETFAYDIVDPYFQKTYFSLLQIFGMDSKIHIPITLMVLAVDIQSRDVNRPYDFVRYATNQLHKSLYAIKKDFFGAMHFRQYSLLLHLILYGGTSMATTTSGQAYRREEYGVVGSGMDMYMG